MTISQRRIGKLLGSAPTHKGEVAGGHRKKEMKIKSKKSAGVSKQNERKNKKRWRGRVMHEKGNGGKIRNNT